MVSSAIVKTEGGWVVVEEMNKTVDNNVVWPGGRVVVGTMHDNMFPGLDFSLAIWAAEVGVGEEMLAILANGSVTCGHAGELGTQGVSEAYNGEPGSSLGV